jgi:cation:H+ antiporter
VDSLGILIPLFLACALVVVIAGRALAVYGDVIAETTGWGTLWVGTILVSVATSLPELITNLSAVIFQEAPGLALGNVYGADMINIFTISVVALIFGSGKLFGGQRKDTQVLVLVSVGLGAIATSIGLTGDYGLGHTSIGGIVIAAAYFGGMKLVYSAGRSEGDAGAEEVVAEDVKDGPPANGKRAFILFGVASLAIIAVAPVLAYAADGIADATSLGASFVGVLAVSIVTTLPEATVTMTAARAGSYGLVLGNIYGSCAFNLFVIPIADLGQAEPLLSDMDTEHFVAAVAAVGLMFMGYLIIRSYQSQVIAWMRSLVYVAPVVYTVALGAIFIISSD